MTGLTDSSAGESPAPVFRVNAGSSTHPGQVRERNEDSCLISNSVFLVADGMGGHQGGAEASALVVEAFAEVGAQQWLDPILVQSGLEAAYAQISTLSAAQGGAPGSTVSGVGLAHQDGRPCWLVFNVGDSRTYRLQGETLEQITVDHTRVREMVDAGRLDEEEAKTHRQRNVITKAVGGGIRQAPSPDQWLLFATEGDRMLMCSDGLTNEVTEQLITATLLACTDPQQAAEELVRLGVGAGGHDNVTAVVVEAVQVSGAEVGTSSPDEEGTHPDLDLVEVGGSTLPDVAISSEALQEGHE